LVLRSPGHGGVTASDPTRTELGAAASRPAASGGSPIVEQLPPAHGARKISVRFHSEPEGAQVIDPSGRVLGRTPVAEDVIADDREHEYLLHRDGYRDKRLHVLCDQDRTMLGVLERTSTPPAPSRISDHARPESPRRSPAAQRGKIDEQVTVDPFKEP